jgi:hypothetical protein
MFDKGDPSQDVGFQLAFDGSFSLKIASGLLENKYKYLTGMEAILDAAEARDDDALAVFYGETWRFRSQLRESFMVSVVAYLEHIFLTTCDDLAVVLRSDILERDLHGRSGFERAKQFLEKVVKEQSFGSATWNKLERYRSVRNIIAHSGHLWVAKNKQKNIRSLPGLVEDENGELELDDTFGVALINFAQEVTSHLSEVAAGVANRTSRFHKNI